MKQLSATAALVVLLAIGGVSTISAQTPPPQSPQPQTLASPPDSRPISAAERIARQYIAAYSAADWDAMEPLISEDFIFVDRTSRDLADHEFRGRGEVMAMLREFGDQGRIVGLFLDFPLVFESNGVVVFAGTVNTLSRSSDPEFGLRWRAEQVTILTVRESRVVRHEDYANYAAPVITRERLGAGQ